MSPLKFRIIGTIAEVKEAMPMKPWPYHVLEDLTWREIWLSIYAALDGRHN